MNNAAPPTDIAALLARTRTIAVVGLSPRPHRTSYGVSQYMRSRGFRIVPVNPNTREVFGEKAYPTLTEAAKHEKIDLVNVFRNAPDVPPVMDEAIAIGAPAVWMQLGIIHEAAAAKGRAAGLEVVQDRCIMVEHSKLSKGAVLFPDR
ncbi:MAG: CoA-binding protein [Variovorax sp.]|nr:MAG: CoA-binding protein [Variovorax sp.]